MTLQRSNPDNRPTADIASVKINNLVNQPNNEVDDDVYLDFVLDKEISQGFGFSMKFEGPSPRVKNVKESSPAAAVGLLEDDEIFTINEKLVENVSSTQVLKMIGEDSFQLRLRIKRTLQPLPMIMTPPTIAPMIAPNDIGFIDLEMSSDQGPIDLKSQMESSDEEEDGLLSVTVKKVQGDTSFGFSMHFGSTYPVIKKINPNSAAERAVLRLDDVIIALNTVKLHGMGQNAVFNLIRESKDEIQLTIKRDENIFDSSSSDDDDYKEAVIVDDEEYFDVIINKQISEPYGFGLDFGNEMPKIKTLKPKSPADQCGLLLHDEIYSINGILVCSISEDTVIDLLRKSPECLNLRVKRINIQPGKKCNIFKMLFFSLESDYDDDKEQQMEYDNTPVTTAAIGLPDFGTEDIPEELIRQHEEELEQIGANAQNEECGEEEDQVETMLPNETPKKMTNVDIDMTSTDAEMSETTEVTMPAPMAPAQTVENDTDTMSLISDKLSDTSTIVSEDEIIDQVAIDESLKPAEKLKSVAATTALISVIETRKQDDESSWTDSQSTISVEADHKLELEFGAAKNEELSKLTKLTVTVPQEPEPQKQERVVETVVVEKQLEVKVVEVTVPARKDSSESELSSSCSSSVHAETEKAVNSTWTEAEIERLEMGERKNSDPQPSAPEDMKTEYRPSQIITQIENQLNIIGELNEAVIQEHINDDPKPVMINAY